MQANIFMVPVLPQAGRVVGPAVLAAGHVRRCRAGANATRSFYDSQGRFAGSSDVARELTQLLRQRRLVRRQRGPARHLDERSMTSQGRLHRHVHRHVAAALAIAWRIGCVIKVRRRKQNAPPALSRTGRKFQIQRKLR